MKKAADLLLRKYLPLPFKPLLFNALLFALSTVASAATSQFFLNGRPHAVLIRKHSDGINVVVLYIVEEGHICLKVMVESSLSFIVAWNFALQGYYSLLKLRYVFHCAVIVMHFIVPLTNDIV